jgi:GntR family transcriptional regulator/MocR family aminotransferase
MVAERVPPALTLDPDADEPLHRQLYDGLRLAVLSGGLRAGTRLASTRTMARELGVSRNTVMAAFNQLLAEGYLQGKVGSGTYVTRTLPDETLRARSVSGRIAAPRPAPVARGRGISQRGAQLIATPVSAARVGSPTAFRPGLPAIDEFPLELWSRILARKWRDATLDLLSYGDPAGYRPLREAIAGHLAVSRSVRCDPDQVVVLSGSQQALDLSARLLLDPGDKVWLEDPGYKGAHAAFAGAGANIVSVPLDREGLDVAEGIRRAPNASLVYITPSHQFPLGVTMSLSRRLALLEWARDAGAWIIEDDYDSEFRYAGRPLAALQGLDSDGRVIYMGTFSKVMLPSLRMGYLVLPPDVAEAFIAARAVSDRHSPSVDQAALAEFITEGHFERHIRRMRMLYADRQAALLHAAERHLSGALHLEPHPAGMQLPAFLVADADDVALSALAREHHVEAQPLSAYYRDEPPRPGFFLGYSGVPERSIRAAVLRLSQALRPYPTPKTAPTLGR